MKNRNTQIDGLIRMINELYGSAIYFSGKYYLIDLPNKKERYGQIAINIYDVC